ncbi:DASH complex subunit dam1 [Yamadazyma tenuis]|uniref:DASH complex subunit DAM1 n=1 Tax=Candida tenuis (strain ATCC 10573 / BCRC 21748 / CBS 615 / JCM 9827 / NBRC 10315 / NRRL Y-1498 / VKM Y-70) TaxID=590646 RepID=G3BCW7_CANTC|nr:uncharacterized protein CANTEDRAFT_99719 [Yamadazyma tenuis ATCC 10573]EGV60226.1 hypothetical protein CANTEDRAFT_99719 [Yamadazyma tenuis ATCC 10573]WEJ94532.1 DASH complex subunit dam1 [Yamadazyma tenuis]
MSSSSKPATPARHRHSHRSSGVFALLPQSPRIHYPIDPEHLPLDSSVITDSFERLHDSVQDLEMYMKHLQRLHEAISQGFNESFSSFLYGLSITMWCIDFPSTPSKDLEEKLEESKRLDDSITDLKSQLRRARQQNEVLKLKLHNKAKVNASILRSKPAINRRLIQDSSKSKIPQPFSRLVVPSRNSGSVSKPPPVRSAIPIATRNTRGPNLNQPPRYLDGLFAGSSTSASSVRRARKPAPISNRPPFR